jgi:ATP-dependent Clp protease ATP-binding subunit ClpC
MERGCLKTGDGVTVDLTDCLIVYTANAGESVYNSRTFGIPNQGTGKNSPVRKALLQDFSSAFLNRVDDIVLFRSYTKEERIRAFEIQASRSIDYLGAHKNSVTITNGFIAAMAEVPMSKEFGLRDLTKRMKNMIMDKCRSVTFGETKNTRLTKADVEAMLEAENGATRNMYSAV